MSTLYHTPTETHQWMLIYNWFLVEGQEQILIFMMCTGKDYHRPANKVGNLSSHPQAIHALKITSLWSK